MKQSSNGYLSNRVLKINIGFLLVAGPGHSQTSELELPLVRVSEDVVLKYVRGPLRFSRTQEGILVQAQLETAVETECYRCLDPVESVFTLDIEELYAYQSSANTQFRIYEDAILDLGPLLREEVLIEETGRVLCQPECKGLCPVCGTNLNYATCQCAEDAIDPRMAALKKLLESN